MSNQPRKILIAFILQWVTIGWGGQGSGQDVCAHGSDREQIECLSQQIDSANKELQTVYEAALAQVPDNDASDQRKNKNQLVKSQNAWQAYVRENCAYVGGAEGGSNLWVTNFASRCELLAVRERTAFLRHEAGLSNAPVSAQQRILETLAAPIPADSNYPKLPASYAQWTADQQRTVPRQIAVRCGVLWTMINSGGKVQLLPQAEDPADTLELATDVCVAGKMPKDWPERKVTLERIDRILQRVRQLGATLSMPRGLTP